PPGRSMIASIASNATGRNLQTWSDNLVAGYLGSGSQAEQLIGRTHRHGQTKPVRVWVYVASGDTLDAFTQAKRDAAYISHTTGQAQKLLSCSDILSDLDPPGQGPRWRTVKS